MGLFCFLSCSHLHHKILWGGFGLSCISCTGTHLPHFLYLSTNHNTEPYVNHTLPYVTIKTCHRMLCVKGGERGRGGHSETNSLLPTVAYTVFAGGGKTKQGRAIQLQDPPPSLLLHMAPTLLQQHTLGWGRFAYRPEAMDGSNHSKHFNHQVWFSQADLLCVAQLIIPILNYLFHFGKESKSQILSTEEKYACTRPKRCFCSPPSV